jgi:hypothetical protein
MNPSIFGPVGTKWTVNYNGGVGEDTLVELRKDADMERAYKLTNGDRSWRETAKKGLCIGGPYDGHLLTETDLRIVNMRQDYLGYARSDSVYDNKLAETKVGRVFLHKTYGEKR